MAVQVSPGVLASVVNESAYGSSGPGTIPLLVIATASNKIQPGTTTTIAPGTLSTNEGTLWTITSQRDVLQTFGNPVFYSSSGTVEYNNELNEIGLFSLYNYMGLASQARVLRANIDLSALIPTTTAPVGPVINGQNWLNLSNTTFGIFKSNGNSNPSFAWQPQVPLVINLESNLEVIVQGYNATNSIINGSAACISANGNLVINGVSIAVTTSDSITSIVSKINGNASLNIQEITATIFARVGKFSPTSSSYGDIYNLRLYSSNINQTILLTGTTNSVLSDLGLTASPTNIILPSHTFGQAGNYAVNTLQCADGTYQNQIWENIAIVTSLGTTNWWFLVGGTDATYPGWGWQAAMPRVLLGTVSNPTFTATNQCTISINGGSTLTVTVPTGGTLSGLVAAINTQLNSSSGTNTVASIYTVGNQNYLQVTNYDSTSIQINDLADQYGVGHPWRDAGILPTNTYWASVTGTVSNPTYTAATLLTSSALPVAPGTGYQVGDQLTVTGGTHTSSSILTVLSLVIDTATPTGGSTGSGYVTNDTLTFSSTGWTTPLILSVQGTSGSPGPITAVSVIQYGQFNGSPALTSAVSATSTSGSGSGATFTLTYGVNTVSVSTPGSYSIYPTNPVSITGGSGSGATFNLTPDWLQSVSFSIDAGTGPVIIHVPASPNNTLTGVINEINTVGFPNGPIVASQSGNCLILTNTNGTSFTVEDIRGAPLNGSGISAGTTFARSLIFKGYSGGTPNFTVPSNVSALAATNVWINTTPANQGANFVLEEYINGTWTQLNITPNTGTIPMYSSTTYADSAFGSLKRIGSIFVQYNYNNSGEVPNLANFAILKWSGSSWVLGNNPSPGSYVFNYTPSSIAPTGSPVDGTLWYNNSFAVDIMVNNGEQWLGYANQYPATDPNGPILSSAQPLTQSTGAALVEYDIWINTDNVNYPTIYRYSPSTTSWILITNTDHVTSAGIIFADARPNADGTINGSTVSSDMVTSNYVDSDAPNALLYAPGMLLFNTRYSTYNVKVFRKNYFTTGAWLDRWITYSGNKPDGTPYMGSQSQRIVVVNALNAELVSNEEARAEDSTFNLIATPGYVECLAPMVSLNTDKNDIAFVIADTPISLPPTGTAITAWATNQNNVTNDGPDGLITSSPYASVTYPWGLGTNLDGTSIVVPPSMMTLSVMAYNDQVAYPWYPAAGPNRGLVSNVTSVGYVDDSGDYNPVKLNKGQRDVLYTNSINPVAYFPGNGLMLYGQKTLSQDSTALDRINVARLINYLVYNLEILAKPFMFELNDAITRQNVVIAFNSFLQNIVTLRGLYDFSVVCDTSNNTPATIDQYQLWIDVAIQPEKAIEFIYIPIRVLNSSDPLPGGSTI